MIKYWRHQLYNWSKGCQTTNLLGSVSVFMSLHLLSAPLMVSLLHSEVSE